VSYALCLSIVLSIVKNNSTENSSTIIFALNNKHQNFDHYLKVFLFFIIPYLIFEYIFLYWTSLLLKLTVHRIFSFTSFIVIFLYFLFPLKAIPISFVAPVLICNDTDMWSNIFAFNDMIPLIEVCVQNWMKNRIEMKWNTVERNFISRNYNQNYSSPLV